MQYNISIDQVKAIEWKLSHSQSALMAFLQNLSSWANEVIIQNKVYYYGSRAKILRELPLFFGKSDTVYRALMSLREKGLIEYFKFGAKDLMRLTDKGKEWNCFLIADKKTDTDKLGNRSEDSEIDPNQLGNKSENNSDLNPTYHNTSSDHTANDKKKKNSKKEKKKRFVKPTIQQVAQYISENKLNVDPHEFFYSNETKGWVVGKNDTPMKNWKTAICTWHFREEKFKKQKKIGETQYQDLDKVEYSNERKRRLRNAEAE